MTDRALPAAVTSYDLLKGAALLLMIVDHIGAYFYPDEMWLRAVGRLSAPVWLFLVGYARSRDLSLRFWGWAMAAAAGAILLGDTVFPLNILFTIAFCRIAVDPLMRAIARAPELLYPAVILLFIGAFLTFPLFEYGTSAMLPVMLGFMARNGAGREKMLCFAVISGMVYTLFEIFLFSAFDDAQAIFMSVALCLLFMALTQFRAATFERLTAALGRSGAGLVRICGRRTLEIYVLHVLLFMAAALALGLSDTRIFDFHIF